jgi:hypothetical protein
MRNFNVKTVLYPVHPSFSFLEASFVIVVTSATTIIVCVNLPSHLCAMYSVCPVILDVIINS